MEDFKAKLRQEFWKNALHTFGFAYIFSRRVRRYSFKINLLTVFGIIVPITVGAAALGYGFNSQILQMAITIAIPAGILQLLISVLAITYKWNDELSYSLQASAEYSILSDDFRKHANFPLDNFEEFGKIFDILKTKYQAREGQDINHEIKERELRRGMRYALREFKKECYGCQKIPIDMKSTNCPVCGKFNISINFKSKSNE